MQLFLNYKDRLTLGGIGNYPTSVIEVDRDGDQKKHDVNENFSRPWIRHHFLTQILKENPTDEAIENRDKNLLEILKVTLPLANNSYIESSLSSWKQFIDFSFKNAEARWYSGSKKIFVKDRFDQAIEQLEIEIPSSNPQRNFLFLDESRFLRKLPKIPVKLFFVISPKYAGNVLEILRQAVQQNPHNRDLDMLAYLFYKGYDWLPFLLDFTRELKRSDFEEWIYWTEDDKKSLAEIKRAEKDYYSSFYFFDASNLSPEEYKEIAEWYLSESEFKLAYHFFYKAKEFEIAQNILQNIGIKEFGALVIMRQLATASNTDLNEANIKNMYDQELETLRGFNKIRTNETFQKISSTQASHFDRETVENKYAFGELTEEEYVKLISQLRERKH